MLGGLGGAVCVGVRRLPFTTLRVAQDDSVFGALVVVGAVGGLGVESVGVFDGLDVGFRNCGVVRLFVFEGERVLLGGERVEFGLAFFTEQAGKLGESDRLFGRVDDSFDLGFKTHGCRVECINPAPMEEVRCGAKAGCV